jgi:hypothetical protein
MFGIKSTLMSSLANPFLSVCSKHEARVKNEMQGENDVKLAQ